MRRALPIALVAFFALSASAAEAHQERPATFPDPALGRVPVLKTSGPSHVVCKPDSRARILKLPTTPRRKALALLPHCRYRHIQAAVNAASNGMRILVLPGVYREEPSRAKPNDDPACAELKAPPASGSGLVPTYLYQRRCPNAENLIAIIGDADADGDCDDRCGLQIVGMGAKPADVLIEGDRRKLNVIRGDRADGIALANFLIQYSDFNNIYVIETNGFRLERIVTRWSREYGILSFVSDNGLYSDIAAYGNGDSGVYTGSGPEGHCQRYGIELRRIDSYANTIGWSGTAGNGVWIHDSTFHGNATGLTLDSAFAGHPGMPQDCAKFERNRIYSNNLDVFTAKRDAYCMRSNLERDPRVVCPTVPVPVGAGMFFAGGNGNIVRGNWLYDNWFAGAMLAWVPPIARGEEDPAKLYEVSHDNQYVSNVWSRRPDGTRDRNGVDVWWDGEGTGNCWSGRTPITADAPIPLPACPNTGPFRPADNAKFALLFACISWHPISNPDPAGCTWLKRPQEPK